MQLTVNGEIKEYTGDPEMSLMTFLREHENITSPKNGCAPQAACGACTVDLNGKAVLSCVTKMSKVADGSVTTTEGLSEYRQDVYSRAFVEKGGIQCGFCIPGIVMRADTLINQNPEPDRSEIEKVLTPHLCRCTGYKKIIDSIEYAAEAIRNEEEIPEPSGNGQGRIPTTQIRFIEHCPGASALTQTISAWRACCMALSDSAIILAPVCSVLMPAPQRLWMAYAWLSPLLMCPATVWSA